MTHPLRLRAFAKINLGLKILAKRPDGFHEIRTVYQTLALHDVVTVTLGRSGHSVRVECDDPSIPAGRANLVHRAGELWQESQRFRGSIEIRVQKRIPAGSGLGGGSSNAAAALLGLERLSGEQMDTVSRFRLAARLGSDVPLFLWGGRVLGCGRGEEVYPLRDLPVRECLVVFPGFSHSTRQAYRLAGRHTSFPLTKRMEAPSMIFGARPLFPSENWGPAENDFEHVVFARWPELTGLKGQLIRAGAEVASLTGSGSAVFALFNSARRLARATQFIPREWKTFRTRTLSRNDYWRQLWME